MLVSRIFLLFVCVYRIEYRIETLLKCQKPSSQGNKSLTNLGTPNIYIYIYIYIFFHDRLNTYFLKPFSPNKFLSEKQVTGRDVNFFTLYGGQFTF